MTIAKGRQVFAVVRYDQFQDASVAPQNRVTVTKVVYDEATAREEVKRLNDLNAGKGCIYFWQTTRLAEQRGATRVRRITGEWL